MTDEKYAIIPLSLLETLVNDFTEICVEHNAALHNLRQLISKQTRLELTNDLKFILSRPNYECMSTAKILRFLGQAIDEKFGAEQSATIHWMLNHYLSDPQNWRQNCQDELDQAAMQMRNQER